MANEKILEAVRKILSKEARLIEIKKAKQIIFVGDTHGDLEASQKVIKDYLKSGSKIVFLGDYVDRGPSSRENLDFLLKTKVENPDQIYLLQGNHEGHHILRFSPADFWQSLSVKEYREYCSIVEKFSLAVTVSNIIALHGALPDVKSLKEINQVEIGGEQWLQVTWGDFVERSGEYLETDIFTGRPRFGKDWFFKLMKRFKKKVLIRSHQPDCPQFMFDNGCLIIFTSSAYTRERTIAIADFKKGIKDAKNLEVIRI